MHVEMETAQDTLLVRITGELDLAVADRLRTLIDLELKNGRAANLILDLHGVDFIDSSGLGVILGRYKKVSGSGGKMYIVRAQPSVSKILTISGVKRIIPLCATEREILNLGGKE